ncbi:MAG TPA: DUF1549 domain-containing protein [Thermoanaerobaculia bacterium]|nr:DUF1549 domain-containing protein [Thermoanaerobaculia bacterium]
MLIAVLVGAAGLAPPAFGADRTVGGASSAAPTCPRNTTVVDVRHQLSQTAEIVAPSGRRRAAGHPATPASLPVVNFIDSWIAAKQAADGVAPTAIASDAEFLRRITLDLTGQIPDTATVKAFLADTSATKRQTKIDELLASDAFVDRWTMWFGDLVQNVQVSNNARETYQGRNAYYLWIRESIRANKPYDAMVRELLAGRGDSFTSGAANYVVRQLQNNGPLQDTFDNLAAHSAEKFLGIPLLCLSCHNGAGHLELVNLYLRGKSRNDFWRMAAFFSHTAARPTRVPDPNNPNNMLVKFDVNLNAAGRYRLNTTDGNKTPRQPPAGGSDVATPAFILTGEEPRANEEYRDAYGRMLTADRQFARATVNYLWKEMFGLGLVEPVNAFDLVKLTNQPSHPELLEALADDFIAKHYDLRALLRTIALSSTYQLSARYTPGGWQEAWVSDYARRYPHRLPAETLLDAIAKATSVPVQINANGLGVVTRAMLLPDPLEGRRGVYGRFLDAFGRGDRDDAARTNDSSISQSLALLNDTIVTTRVRRDGNTTVAKVLAASNDPGTIADELFLATLSRKPDEAERQTSIDYLRAGTLGERAEDLQFALLNSLEFLFN